jgi:AraC-like DNA-binding protein
VPTTATFIAAPPPPDLAEVVEFVWQLTIRIPRSGAIRYRLVRCASVDLLFPLVTSDGRGVRGAPATPLVFGAARTTHEVYFEGASLLTGIRIRAGHAARLLSAPLDRLNDRFALADTDIWQSARLDVASIAEARSAARLAATAAVRRLVSHSGRIHSPSLDVEPRVLAALAVLDAKPALVQRGVVRWLAREVGASPRTLERLFLTHVGVSPRRHVLLRRIARVASTLESNASDEPQRATRRTARTLSLVAHEMGFADHAHLTRQFRRIVGLLPSEYRLEASRAPIARLWVGMPADPALPLGTLVAADSPRSESAVETSTVHVRSAIAV